ncbi:hypothetical protein NKH77_44715 [Streptomyces sp. M19]
MIDTVGVAVSRNGTVGNILRRNGHLGLAPAQLVAELGTLLRTRPVEASVADIDWGAGRRPTRSSRRCPPSVHWYRRSGRTARPRRRCRGACGRPPARNASGCCPNSSSPC